MFYVYEWFIKETNEIIYVGKGTNRRYKVRKHNKFFNDFIKRSDCDSRIIKFFENENDAFQYEFERIRELKSKNQCVCNIYDGGFGGTQTWWTNELREKYSRNNVMKSESQRKRMREKNPMKNPEIANRTNSQKKKKICVGNKIFDGLIDVAKEYNIKDTAVSYWLKRGYTRDLKPCYYWGEEKPNYEIIKRENIGKAVFIGEFKFPTVKKGAEFLKISSTTLIRAIKDGRPLKGYKCYYDNQQPSQEKTDKSILEGSTTNE